MFAALIPMLLQMGLPILGQALAGPFGITVAQKVADAIGAPSSAPGVIKDRIINMSPEERDVAIQRLKSVEAQWIADVQAESTVATTQLGQVGNTMRAELELREIGGRAGTFIAFMQASWRPLFAYETLCEMAGGALLVTWAILSGKKDNLQPIMDLLPFIQFYLPLKLTVLGVYAWGRTREKEADKAATATTVGGVVGNVLKRIGKG